MVNGKKSTSNQEISPKIQYVRAIYKRITNVHNEYNEFFEEKKKMKANYDEILQIAHTVYTKNE